MRHALTIFSAFCLIAVAAWLIVRSPNAAHAGGGYEAGVALVNQTNSIPATVIKCNGAPCAAGFYRASIACVTTTAGKGTVSITLTGSNFGLAQTLATGSCNLLTQGSTTTGSIFAFYLDGSVSPTYSATVTLGPGTAVWRAGIALERLQ